MPPPPDIWATTRKRIFTYRRQDFWAENGLCHVVDKDTGLYSCVSIADFLYRARGFSKMAERGKHDKTLLDERDELTRMVQDMIVCCQQARQQGDPFDVRTVNHVVNHSRSNRVSMTQVPPKVNRIIVSGSPQVLPPGRFDLK